jgi:hypothetical protein
VQVDFLLCVWRIANARRILGFCGNYYYFLTEISDASRAQTSIQDRWMFRRLKLSLQRGKNMGLLMVSSHLSVPNASLRRPAFCWISLLAARTTYCNYPPSMSFPVACRECCIPMQKGKRDDYFNIIAKKLLTTQRH